MRVGPGVKMPRRATRQSAGYDFYAKEDIVLHPGEWTDIGTGVYLEDGDIIDLDLYKPHPVPGMTYVMGGRMSTWCMLLLPKSGLGTKYGVRMANTIGLVDMDYRGEIRAKLTAFTDVTIPAGKAYMQGVIIPFGVLVGEEPPTKERGTGGFGSTGQ